MKDKEIINMKKIAGIVFILLFFMTLLINNNQNIKGNKYYICSSHHNSTDESRASLLNCLKKEEVEYKIDEKNDILIKHKDADTAVGRCA